MIETFSLRFLTILPPYRFRLSYRHCLKRNIFKQDFSLERNSRLSKRKEGKNYCACNYFQFLFFSIGSDRSIYRACRRVRKRQAIKKTEPSHTRSPSMETTHKWEGARLNYVSAQKLCTNERTRNNAWSRSHRALPPSFSPIIEYVQFWKSSFLFSSSSTTFSTRSLVKQPASPWKKN